MTSRLSNDWTSRTRILTEVPHWNRLSYDESNPVFMEEFDKAISDAGMPEADSTGDHAYINMEVFLPRGIDSEVVHSKVKAHTLNAAGSPIGKESLNPIIDTRLYEVEFIDGSTKTIATNVIAENLLSQVDQEGHWQLLIDKIIDHRSSSDTILKQEGTYLTSIGARPKKQMARGWELCIQWKDGSTNWVALKDMKNSFPVEAAEYAVNNQI